MLDVRPLDQAPSEQPILVIVSGLLNTVGIKDNRTREILKLLVLVLPSPPRSYQPNDRIFSVRGSHEQATSRHGL